MISEIAHNVASLRLEYGTDDSQGRKEHWQNEICYVCLLQYSSFTASQGWSLLRGIRHRCLQMMNKESGLPSSARLEKQVVCSGFYLKFAESRLTTFCGPPVLW